MSQDDKSSGLGRLSDAVAAFLSHKNTSEETDQEFLARHPEWKDLLEPMVEGAGPDDRSEELESGARVLGDFRLLREVGRGGMGVVFEAEQISLGRRVALKVLPSHATSSAKQIERFRREASAASRLRHPGIAPIYEVGEDNGTHFFAMEFVSGQNLQRWIEDAHQQCDGEPGRLDSSDGRTWPERCAEIVAQVAEALAVAHDEGIFHRDIKPQNILLDEQGQVRVVDFGLAKDTERLSISASSDFAGTPHYMSPEQVSGLKAVDSRTDVFSLGVVLFELLTLRPPFDAETAQGIFQAITSREPRPLKKLNSRVPPDLETICQKALEKEPWLRYETMADMAADLRAFLAGEPIAAQPSGPITKVWKFARRRRAASAAIVLGGLLVISVPLMLWMQENKVVAAVAKKEKEGKRETKRAVRKQLVKTQLMLRDQVRDLEPLAARPGVEPQLRQMVSRVVSSYRKLFNSDLKTLSVRCDLVRMLTLEARVYLWLNDLDKARKCYQEAARHGRDLTDVYPRRRSAWVVRAEVSLDTGSLFDLSGRQENAQKAAAEARRYLAEAAKYPLVDKIDWLAEISAYLEIIDVGWGLDTTQGSIDLSTALPLLDRAIQKMQALPKARLEYDNNRKFLAIAYHRKARILLRQRRNEEAHDCIEKAIGLARKRAEERPGHPRLLMSLAGMLKTRARLHGADGELAAFRADSDEAEKVLRGMIAQGPDLVPPHTHLVDLYRQRAILEVQMKDLDAARDALRKGFEVAARLQGKGERERRLLRSLGQMQEMNGSILVMTDRSKVDQGIAEIQKGIGTLASLAEHFPDWGALHGDLATSYRNLAACHARKRQNDKAQNALLKVIEHRKKAFELRRGDPFVKKGLESDLNELARFAMHRIDHALMARMGVELRKLQDSAAGTAGIAALFANCHRVAFLRGKKFGDPDGTLEKAAEAYAELTFSTLNEAVEKGLRRRATIEEPAFGLLKGDARFAKLVERLERSRKREGGGPSKSGK